MSRSRRRLPPLTPVPLASAPLVALMFLVAVLLLPRPSAAQPAPAGPAMRSDSTVADAWRLGNGLEVRTLHIPRAAGVSVTLAIRAGSGYEPAAQEGLSELCGELAFTGAAGDVPERTREEMASLRPLGWECRPGTRLVRFTEVATPAQLPGVLHQIAARLGGVQVTDAAVKAALARVRRDCGARLFGEPSDVLYWRPLPVSRGVSDDQLIRRAGLPALDRISARDVAPVLQRWYQAGNASLALVGDLSGVDVHALVGSQFGALAGGPAMPDTVQVRIRGAKRVTAWTGLEAPAGVLAVAAPALSDTLHPAFYLGLLVTASSLIDSWGKPAAPLTSRFQYSLFDDPELVRFYPPVRADATDPDLLAGALHEQLQVIGGQMVDLNVLNRVRRSVRWLLGAELPPELLARMRREAGGLGTLSNGLATRALWRGDAFWADYLRRFDATMIGHSYFYEWLADASHQISVLLTPRR